MLKSKKIVIIISIFAILFSFFISHEVYATSDLIDVSYYDNIIKELGNRPYFLSRNDKNYFALFAYPCQNHFNHWDFDNDDIYFFVNNNVLTVRNSTKNQETTHFADYACENGKDIRCVHSCWNGNSSFAIDDMKNGHEMYTNVKVYTNRDRKEVFFFKTLPITYQIPQITETKEIITIIKGVMKVILPTGLTIFGILFVILLIRLVISHKI